MKANQKKTGGIHSKRTVKAGTARNKTKKGQVFGKWQPARRLRKVRSA